MIEGQHITPTLRLVRQLGRGGMGSVWIADHLTLHTQVAVKFMFVHFANNAAFVRRFQAEAQAAAQIKSQHVAQVFDNGITEEGEPYIVMELLDGEDLRNRIKRGGPLSPAEFLPILQQVCKALTRAHQVGIVHRDIKPDNVFLANMGDDILVKILDFGIAKLNHDDMSATSTGSMLGTPFYMSPEQLLSSRAVDFRTDLWSLGVVAYQALTGVRPFNGETIGALSVAVNSAQFVPASSVRPELSQSIDAWVAKSLQRDASKRWNSAREMADEFEKAMQDPLRNAEQVAGNPGTVDGGVVGALGTTGATSRNSITGATTGANGRPSTLTPAPTGPTLVGTETSTTEARPSKTPLAIGIGLVAVALVGGGLYFATRGPSNGGAHAAAATTGSPVAPPPVATAAPAPAVSSAPVAKAEPPKAETTAKPIDMDESEGSSASASKKKPVAAAPAGGRAAPARPAAPAAAAPAAPAPKKDTIGF